MIERYLPVGLGGATTIAASMVDINWGAIAGGITIIGTAGAAAYWNFASKRTAAYKDAEAAKLKAFQDDAAARLEADKAAEAAKLQAYRESELAKIELQRRQDEANKVSLSAQMTMMSGQLTAIQRSADEANRSLVDAREMNRLLREQLDAAAERIEDANQKLHTVLNEANTKNLKHEIEKRELQAAKDDVSLQLAEVTKQLAAIRQSTEKVSSQLTPLVPLPPRVADNTARLDRIDGGGGARGDAGHPDGGA